MPIWSYETILHWHPCCSHYVVYIHIKMDFAQELYNKSWMQHSETEFYNLIYFWKYSTWPLWRFSEFVACVQVLNLRFCGPFFSCLFYCYAIPVIVHYHLRARPPNEFRRNEPRHFCPLLLFQPPSFTQLQLFLTLPPAQYCMSHGFWTVMLRTVRNHTEHPNSA